MGIGETGDYSLSAAAVKALNPSKVGHFCLGKFAADFKSIEKWTLIAGGDVRNIEGTRGGLAWVAPTPGTSAAARQAAVYRRAEPEIIIRGGTVAVTFPPMSRGTVSILTLTGRLVAASSGAGSAVCEIGNQPAGTYVVKVSTGSHAVTKSLMIQR